jgi:hypothetical protein
MADVQQLIELEWEVERVAETAHVPTCQVCGERPGVGVASSVLGAFSVAYCDKCLFEGAEPLGDWIATIWICGDPSQVSEEFKSFAVAWLDGRYIKWDEIIAEWEKTTDPFTGMNERRDTNDSEERIEGGHISI